MNDWETYFRQSFLESPFTELGFEGEDKNLLAHNSVKEYIDWFCRPPGVEQEPYRDNGFYPRELTEISMSLNPVTIAEFGTNIGQGTFMLSRLNPRAHVWTIDIEDDVPAPGDLRLPVGHIAKINDCPSVHYIKGNSWDFSARRIIDLCFIDGDRSYEAVLKDSYNAWENRSNRWAIIWHDYRKDLHGLRSAVDEFCQDVGVTLNKKHDSTTVHIEGIR